jgi:predicted RNA-binding Zn-ribbon protein involved in translation (DUF1610 family)
LYRDEESSSSRRKRRKRSSSVSSSSSSSSDNEAERRKRKKRKEEKKKKKKRSKDTHKSKQRSPSVERIAEEPSEAQIELGDSTDIADSATVEPQAIAVEPAAAHTDTDAAAHSDAHAMAPPPPVMQAPAAVAAAPPAAAAVPVPKVSKAAFFAKLQAVEARKEPVGTVHSKGKSVYTTSKTLKTAETSDKWECPKCGTEQNKHNTSCEKCHGLKRLSVWR